MEATVLSIIWGITQVFLLWLGADFLTGVVHWWQDAYGNPTWPIIGKHVIEPNLKHHHDPRAMLKISYWRRMYTSIYAAIVIIGVLILCNAHSWQAITFIVFSSQGNEIHAMGHRTDKENGRIVVFLQKIGIVQRRKTHGWHHQAPYDTNFCVMTEFLNPVLNGISFWNNLEWVIKKLLRIKPLRGSAIRGGV